MKRTKNKYRSALEKEFSKEVKRKGFTYEPYDVPYTVYRKYKPDFVHEEKKVMVDRDWETLSQGLTYICF